MSRTRRRRWLALGIAIAMLAGTLALVAGRRRLAERALVAWLGAHGVAATPRVARLGWLGLEVRGLVVGPVEAPDLVVERIAAAWSLTGLVGGRIHHLALDGVRLHASIGDGGLSLGALDALRGPGDGAERGAPALPVDAIDVRDLHVDLDAPAGACTGDGGGELRREGAGLRGTLALRGATPWGDGRLAAAAVFGGAGVRWRLDAASAALVVLGGARVAGARLAVRGVGDRLRATVALEATLPGEPPPLTPLVASATLRGTLGRLDLEAQVAPASGAPVLRAAGPVEPGAGRAELALAVAETDLAAVPLARLVPALDGVVGDVTGTLSGEGYLRRRDGRLGAELTLALRDVGAATPLATVRGLAGVVTLVPFPALATPPGQLVSMAAIEGPLPLEDGLVRFRLEPGGTLVLERARWTFAGGTVGASGRLPLAAAERRTTLVAEALDLHALLASLSLEGLSGTGTLAGELPLRQEGGRVLVEDGRLRATGSGTLRYRRDAGAPAGSGQLAMLLAVLDDFRYDELELTLAGDLAGAIDMHLHLRGRNPGYQGGRPVVFNVNVEAPLVGLVRAGLSAYRIPEAVEQRLETMGGGGRR